MLTSCALRVRKRLPGSQVRSLFRRAFPGGNSSACACAFQLSCLLPRGGPGLQVIPPLPRSAGPIVWRWEEFSRWRPAHTLCESSIDWLAPGAQVRASYWAWAEREPPKLSRPLQVSAHTRRSSRIASGARVGAQACGEGRQPGVGLQRLSLLLRPLLLRRRGSRGHPRGSEGGNRPRLQRR